MNKIVLFSALAGIALCVLLAASFISENPTRGEPSRLTLLSKSRQSFSFKALTVNEDKNIPKHFHFVVSAGNCSERPFTILEYVSVRSAIEVHQPETVSLYYVCEPTGEWWDRVKELPVHLEPLNSDSKDQDTSIVDLSVKVLSEHGGVYHETDVISLLAYPEDNYNFDFVIGEQANLGLSTAVLMSRPNSSFSLQFISMESENEETGSSKLGRLVQVEELQEVIKILQFDSLAFAASDLSDLHLLQDVQDPHQQEEDDEDVQAHSYHPWESSSFDKYICQLTVDKVFSEDSHLHRMMRPYLEDFHDKAEPIVIILP